MKMKIGLVVDIGVVSDHNDDRILAGKCIYNNEEAMIEENIPCLVAVCDGVGGYGGGGIAAELALKELQNYSPDELEKLSNLETAFKNIELSITEKQVENNEYSSMCTTIAGMIFGKDKITLFHSGDSRIYHYDGCFLRQLTRDHSKIQEVVDSGIFSKKEADKLINRSLITRCLGQNAGTIPEIQVDNITLQENEFYLLCTDGLWDVMERSRIKEVLDNDRSLLDKAKILVNMAKSYGSEDNISVCICGLSDIINSEEDNTFFF